MIPYARLSPGAGFKADQALFYYSQRLVTQPPLRGAISALVAAWIKSRQGAPAAATPGDAVLNGLRRDGFAMLPPLLSPDAASDMAAYFQSMPVVGPNGAPTRLEDLPSGTGAAGYSLETVLNCPGVPEVMNDPRILQLAADYLGCKPTISSVGVRWSLPSPGGGVRFQDFHRDVDDWRFFKVFVYLSDVDEECGPHTYVKRTHDIGFSWKDEQLTLADIERRFGADSLATVTGPKGTSFAADTLGVHRGGRPTGGARLMLQIQYSLLPIFAFDYGPVEADTIPGDPFSNRLLFRRPAAKRQADAQVRPQDLDAGAGAAV